VNPLINILIRTSNRPKYFYRCIESIKSQFYQNYRIIVSADDLKTQNYVRNYDVEHILVNKLKPTPQCSFPYNLYLNCLCELVDDGFILILDDDDHLADDQCLVDISKKLTNPEALLICKMIWPNGRIIPSDDYWKKLPVRGQIGMPCFIFHHSLTGNLSFDGEKAADIRFFHKLFELIPNKIWFDRIIVKTGNTGLHGRCVDFGS